MNISSWLNHIVQVSAPGGLLVTGERTYADPLPVACRVEEQMTIVNSQGTDVVSNTTIYTRDNLDLDCKIWLPDMGLNRSPRKILAKKTLISKSGYTYYEVYL